MTPETSGPWTGKSIGKYEIGPLIGLGGMAEVYKGRHPDLERDVAVKLIHPHLTSREGFVDRFRREGVSLAKLRHPNIVHVYDSGNQEGVYFLVMEFIDGPTLAERMAAFHNREGAFPIRDALMLLITLCGALDYAHRENMIHRDVKPGNVMFNSRELPILTDFGLVKMIGSTLNTVSGTVLGSPMYMSPEQAYGKPGDARSDIYSLGVMLFEMVAGKPPFDGDTPLSIILKHVNEPLPKAQTINPKVPESLDRIIGKTTAKDPAGRYQNCGEFAAALQTELSAVSAPQPLSTMEATSPVPARAETTLSLDFLPGVLTQVLGPVGAIMDWSRIVRGMGEDPKAFPGRRIPELLTRLEAQYRITDSEKRAEIRRLVNRRI